MRITEAYARALAVAGRKDEAEAALEGFPRALPRQCAGASPRSKTSRPDREQIATVGTPVEGAAEALAGIGAAVGQEGGLEVASLYLRLALYLDPQTAGGLAALSLGNLLDASGQGEAAIEAFESIAPQSAVPRARRAAGGACARPHGPHRGGGEGVQGGDRAAARTTSRPTSPSATCCAAASASPRPPRSIRKAIERIPTPGKADWSLFYFRGIAYERTKEWDKAEADFKKALEL